MKPVFLQKKRLGLALGGGGARGLVHIGVLKALQESNLQPDCLAGVSMGGLIAAAYALGISPDEMERLSRELAQTRKLLSFIDHSLPRHGLVKGTRLLAFFEEITKGRTFEQLPIPLTLVAVDLNSGKEVHLNKGSIAEALRATISVPGLIAPFEKDGQRLVDGSLLNNVPVDVMTKMGAEVTAAVSVYTPGDKASVWKMLQDTPVISGTVGDLIGVLGDSLDLLIQEQRVHKLNQAKPDFLIQPLIPKGISVVSGYDQAGELVQLGKDTTLKMLPDIRKALQPRYLWQWPYKPAFDLR